MQAHTCSHSHVSTRSQVFYYSHHVFLMLFAVVLLHADGSWKYILAGIVLWVVDRAVRVMRAMNAVEVKEASIVGMGNVLKLSYHIQAGGKLCSDLTTHKVEPLLHGMGQYCFINVPDISHTEWHPFSISTAADDPLTTHHIQNMGPDTFTGKLHRRMNEAMTMNRVSSLRINVDGPYGSPLEYWRYEKIVFMGGGIGITPLHSSFRTLYVLAKAGLLPVTRVHLIWVAKSPVYFEMFSDTFHTVARDSLHTRFKFSFFVTQEHSVRTKTSLPYQLGRPNLLKELVGLSAYGMHALMYVSGPKDLKDTCRKLAMQCGIDFQAENFEL